MSHYYAKFKENPCVGTDASTPLYFDPLKHIMDNPILIMFYPIGKPSEYKE